MAEHFENKKPGLFESLFSRASSHGVDMRMHAAKAAESYGPGAPRRAHLMRQLSATGTDTRIARPRGLASVAELGVSLKGLQEQPFLAAMYSMALDGQVRPKLFSHLRASTSKIARRQGWPERAPARNGHPQHYGDAICGLVLDEDWLRPIFQAAPQLYWIYLDIDESAWRKDWFGYYLHVRSAYDRWVQIARSHVERRICRELHGIQEPDAA